MSTLTGYNGATLKGTVAGDVFNYSVGSGDVTIVGIGGEDTVSIGGSISRTSNSGDDVIFQIGSGSLTVKNAKGKYLNIVDANGRHASTVCGASYAYSPQDVIKRFMLSLDQTTLSGTKAIDEAVRAASYGAYQSVNALVADMTLDAQNHGADNFLRDDCGIILDNADTGAVTGWDMGNPVVKTAQSIVPETGTFDNFSDNSFTVKGLTVRLATDFASLSSDQKLIWRGNHTWWIEQGLQLIEDSYGDNYGFGSNSSATVKDMTVEFHPTLENDFRADTCYNVNTTTGKNQSTILEFSMKYFGSVNADDPNGSGGNSSLPFYFDRTIAHELTHAVMNNNIRYTNLTPLYIKEGMAEFTHGLDDQSAYDIRALAANPVKLKNVFVGGDTSGIYSPEYAGGYILLKYLSKQAASFNDEAVNVRNDLDGAQIIGSALNDSIRNGGARTTITGGAGADSIDNYIAAIRASIYGGAGNDTIDNSGARTTIYGGAGSDYILNRSTATVTAIYAGDDNDSIDNSGARTTIYGGSGLDYIDNRSIATVTAIYAGAGDDSIINYASYVTMSGGAGNDTITAGGSYKVINYFSGDGYDVITGVTATDTINITGGTYSTVTSGNDVIVRVGSGSMTLKDAVGKSYKINGTPTPTTPTVPSGSTTTVSLTFTLDPTGFTYSVDDDTMTLRDSSGQFTLTINGASNFLRAYTSSALPSGDGNWLPENYWFEQPIENSPLDEIVSSEAALDLSTEFLIPTANAQQLKVLTGSARIDRRK